MKTMLSIPRTISSAASVRNAIQACGSEIHSMLVLSENAPATLPASGSCYTQSAGSQRAGRGLEGDCGSAEP